MEATADQKPACANHLFNSSFEANARLSHLHYLLQAVKIHRLNEPFETRS